jgi:Ni,Fe-hydrogenase I small subunit
MGRFFVCVFLKKILLYCQVHSFDRVAEELVARAAERQAVVAAAGMASTLGGVQTLSRAHDDFERGVAALGAAVAALHVEAERLTKVSVF